MHIYMTEIMSEKKNGTRNQTSDLYATIGGAKAALESDGFIYMSEGSDFASSEHQGKMCFEKRIDRGSLIFDLGLAEIQHAYITYLHVNP